MLASAVAAIVRFCTRFPWPIIVLGLAAAAASAAYSAAHFAINTDYNKLISPTLDWRRSIKSAIAGGWKERIVRVMKKVTEWPLSAPLAF
jgi:hypothetical protein